jgi:hypothetical protein
MGRYWLASASRLWGGLGPHAEAQRNMKKPFFSEEKKQKTFVSKASSANTCAGTPTKMPLQTKA